MSNPPPAEAGTSRLLGPPPPQSTLDSCKKFMCDQEAGKCMGRTPQSWVEIIVFYIFFYLALGLKIYIVVTIFYSTVDDKIPKLRGMDTLLRGNPGLVATREDVDDNRKKQQYVADAPILEFNAKKNSSYKPYIKEISLRLKEFYKAEKKIAKKPTASCKNSSTDKLCERERDILQWKNKTKDCSSDNDFGFSKGQPCILLTLNKVYGWEPKLENSSASGVGVVCKARDNGKMGKIEFIPRSSFPTYFFPYMNSKDNISYPIFVKFLNPPSSVVIECQAKAKNIKIPVRRDRYNINGLAIFSLKIKA